MDDELLIFLCRWLEINTDLAVTYDKRLDSRTCHIAIKYLIDGQMPTFKPTEYEIKTVYCMYEIIPESLRAKLDALVGHWKQIVFKDPDLDPEIFKDSKPNLPMLASEYVDLIFSGAQAGYL